MSVHAYVNSMSVNQRRVLIRVVTSSIHNDLYANNCKCVQGVHVPGAGGEPGGGHAEGSLPRCQHAADDRPRDPDRPQAPQALQPRQLSRHVSTAGVLQYV